MIKQRFQEHLLKSELIQGEQLRTALRIQAQTPHKKLGQILCDQGFLEESDLLKVLSHYSGIPVFPGIGHAFSKAPADISHAKKYHACPFLKDKNGLHMVMLDPENLLLLDQLQQHYQSNIIPYHITEGLLAGLIEFYEHRSNTSLTDHEKLIDLDRIITRALRDLASDIHCQPTENHLVIRARVDGILRIQHQLSMDLWPSLRTQMKVLASMDVAEERKPQVGRFQKSFAGREIDFRVSSHPTVTGENIVIRILDKKRSLLSLEMLGFNENHKRQLRNCIKHNHGLILFTGPTGSGKTTSLYALLSEMDSKTRNIMTLEQPVEYAIPGIRQSEINQNMTFAAGVRSLLRQDPDVILIGEIRDEDTAHMALRASMTGHLVLTTLHTHDVFSATHRLMNLGVSSDLLSDHLLCIVSQRLVRKICTVCHNKGCDACQQTGFNGRICISECLMMTDDLRDLISKGASPRLLKGAHRFSLWDDGREKIKAGLTTMDEVIRVLGPCPDIEELKS